MGKNKLKIPQGQSPACCRGDPRLPLPTEPRRSASSRTGTCWSRNCVSRACSYPDKASQTAFFQKHSLPHLKAPRTETGEEMTRSESSLVRPIHTPVPSSLHSGRPKLLFPLFRPQLHPDCSRQSTRVTGHLGEGREDHSCVVGSGRKPSALHFKPSLEGHKASTR